MKTLALFIDKVVMNHVAMGIIPISQFYLIILVKKWRIKLLYKKILYDFEQKKRRKPNFLLGFLLFKYTRQASNSVPHKNADRKKGIHFRFVSI